MAAPGRRGPRPGARPGTRSGCPPPGGPRADPEDWWLATRAAVTRPARPLAGGGPASPSPPLAVAGQMHGVVLVDDRGAPLRPGDPVARPARGGRGRQLRGPALRVHGRRSATGRRPAWPGRCSAGWRPTSRAPSRAAWWALQPKDWLRLRLTGQAATDPTDASGTLLFDLARERLGRPPHREAGRCRGKSSRRSATRPSLAGPLLPGPAADLGLPPGIPVAVGAADTAAALLRRGPARRRGDAEPRQRRPVGRSSRTRVPPGRHHQPVPGGRRRLLPAGPGAERRHHPRLGAQPARRDLGRAVRHRRPPAPPGRARASTRT